MIYEQETNIYQTNAIKTDIDSAKNTANGKNRRVTGPNNPGTNGFVAGDIWFQNVGGTGDDVDYIIAVYNFNGTSWEQQPLTSAAFAYIDAVKITTGRMSSPSNSDTFWDLDDGEFQNYDIKTLTGYVESTDGGTPIESEYDVTTKTRIDNGELTVVGARVPAEGEEADDDTTFGNYGLQANSVDYEFYEQLPGDIPQTSLTYPHGGVTSRGGLVTSFGGTGKDQHDEDVDSVRYNPKSELTPDYVELGKPENPVHDGGEFDGVSYPYTVDRNVLRLTGGWVERREAILFKKYYDHAQDYQGHVRDFYDEPIICRPAWDIVPGETITLDHVRVVGLLSSGKNTISLTVPLSRPWSEDVISCDMLLTVTARQGSTVLLNNADVAPDWQGFGYDYCEELYLSDAGLTFRIHKFTGTWSSGTAYGMVFVTLTGDITALDSDPYNP